MAPGQFSDFTLNIINYIFVHISTQLSQIPFAIGTDNVLIFVPVEVSNHLFAASFCFMFVTAI